MVLSISLTKALTIASLSSDTPPLPSQSKPKLILRRSNRLVPQKTVKQNQPSISEIERAIGAGIFRDGSPGHLNDSSSDPEAKNQGFFDAVLSNSIGRTEGSLERTLRETGEWISIKTERAAGSSGKTILKVMFLWVLPAWLLSLLFAGGVIKLPFNIPALNDLIM